MNLLLWTVQVILGLYFIGVGILHFAPPPGLPIAMSWMYDLSKSLHYFSGTAEILGGAGLILPGITKVQTKLTPLASAGLALVMIGAIGYHALRGEFQNIAVNVVLLALALFIAYERWNIHPLQTRHKS